MAAAAVDAISATPSEVPPEAQNTALNLLAFISGQGGLVTPDVARLVADALSNIVSAIDFSDDLGAGNSDSSGGGSEAPPASAPPAVGGTGLPSLPPPNLKITQVLNVVEQLASSLQLSLTVPGEQPVQITTAALQARCSPQPCTMYHARLAFVGVAFADAAPSRRSVLSPHGVGFAARLLLPAEYMCVSAPRCRSLSPPPAVICPAGIHGQVLLPEGRSSHRPGQPVRLLAAPGVRPERAGRARPRG